MNAVDDLLERLKTGCREAGLMPAAPVVVGVSGGVDSVSLLHGLAQLGYVITVAHVNYGLRGEESDADERLVRSLATTLGLSIEVKNVTLPTGNVQAEARRARYAFFEKVAEESGGKTIAVGHTEDDQIESVLLGLLREASPRAVTGMLPRRNQGHSVLIRPMLGISREVIQTTAESAGWEWRQDSSNLSDDYLRNTLRHRGASVFHSRGWIDLADNVKKAFDSAGPPRDLQRLATRTVGGWALPVQDVSALSAGRRHGVFIEALRAWLPNAPRRESVGAELDDLLHAQPGRLKAWGRAKVVRDRDRLTFLAEPLDWSPVSLDGVKEVKTPVGNIRVEAGESEPQDLSNGLRLSRTALPDVIVRPWQSGDRIALEHGSVLLSDALTDARVPPSVKPVWPVVEGPEGILWVPGARTAVGSEEDDATESVVLTWHEATA